MKTILYYGCYCRSGNGIFCPAKIWLRKQTIEDENEKESVNWVTERIIGEHTHPAEQAAILASSIVLEMQHKSLENPDDSAPKIRKETMADVAKKYKNSIELLREIVAEMGSEESIERKIQRFKFKINGKPAKNRDDVDARGFFKDNEQDDIVVLDSNDLNDLPENWNDILNKPDSPETERNWENVKDNLFKYEREAEEYDSVIDSEDDEDVAE